MCGIAGLIQYQSDIIQTNTTLKQISDSLVHRGPDDYGYLSYSSSSELLTTRDFRECEANNRLFLLHRRLSILDLSEAGWQPMVSPNKKYAITFNGEIYNYLELQSQLESLGHSFQTKTDTEVLLTAYIQWGEDMLKKLIGMFAFAILDISQQKLFIARDFFGIKPLYFSCLENGFVFASEIKALLCIPQIKRTANQKVVYNFLSYGTTNTGSDTLFLNIQQVPPSHYINISLTQPPQSVDFQRYWNTSSETINHNDISFSEAVSHCRDLFLKSIELHLRSDVLVGVALSGGIDSSSIATGLRYLYPQREICGFSYISEEKSTSEEQWIDLIIKSAQITSHKAHPSSQDFAQFVDDLIIIQDEPFTTPSLYAQYKVFELAKNNNIKVILDGQGGDELLAGYFHPYLSARLGDLIHQGKWLKAKKFLHNIDNLPGTNNYPFFKVSLQMISSESRKSTKSLIKKTRSSSLASISWLEEIQSIYKLDILKKHLIQGLEFPLQDYLHHEDRNSMFHSVESRVPFLNPELANFLFSLPEEYLISLNGTTKYVFREAMKGILPPAIIKRKDKLGFAVPQLFWINSLASWVESLLDSDAIGSIPFLNRDILAQEYEATISQKKQIDPKIWRFLSLIRWTELYNIDFS